MHIISKRNSLSLFTFLILQLQVLALGISPAALNYGKVNNFTAVTATLTFTNNEKEVIKLDTLRTGCGCATAGYEKGKLINPNESYEVEIKFNPQKFKGIVRKKAFLKYSYVDSDMKSKVVKIPIVANVKQLLTVKADTTALSEKTPVQTITLTHSTSYPITDLKVVTPPSFITCKVLKSEKQGSIYIHRIQLTLKEKPEKTHSVNLSFSGTHSSKKVSVPYTLKITK